MDSNNKDIDNNLSNELDIKIFLRFLKRNNFFLVVLYLLSLIPTFYIFNKIISKSEKASGVVEIFFRGPSYPDISTNNSIIKNNTFNLNLNEEVNLIGNSRNIEKIYNNLKLKEKIDLNTWKKKLQIKPEIQKSSEIRDSKIIKISYYGKTISEVEFVLNSLLDNYKKETLKNQNNKKNIVLEKLRNELRNINIENDSYKAILLNCQTNKANKKGSCDELFYTTIINMESKSRERLYRLTNSIMFIETTAIEPWELIYFHEISELKPNYIKLFSFLSILNAFILIFIFYLKENFFGPIKNKDLIEKIIGTEFLADLSYKDDTSFKNLLILANLKTDKKLFKDSIVIVPFGNIKPISLKKLQDKIADYSKSKISLSENVLGHNESEKIILVKKNNSSITLKEIKDLKEKIYFLKNNVLGWFTLD